MPSKPKKENPTRFKSVELMIIALCFLTYFSLPRRMWVDGQVRFDALTKLLGEGVIPSSSYSMVGPLFSSPLWLLGKVFYNPEFWCISFNFIVFLIGAWFFYNLLKRYLDAGVARIFVIIFFSASMFPEHIKNYYSEVFSAITAAAGLVLTLQNRYAKGWAWTAVSVANTPATLIGLLGASTKIAFDTKRVRYFIALSFPVLIIMAENWIRRGGPLTSGYEGNVGPKSIMPYSGISGFSYPFFFGLLSILFSFGKGIFFYAPGLLLPIKQFLGETHFLTRLHRVWIWYLAGLVIIYSKWWCWSGDTFWGPRFFLFASIPATLAIAIYRRYAATLSQLITVWLIMTFSFWVGLDSAVFGFGNLGACYDNPTWNHLCWYVPEFSALFRPFVVGKTLNIRDYFIFAVYGIAYFYTSSNIVKKIYALVVCKVRQMTNDMNFRF